MTIDDKIRDETLKHDINKKTCKNISLIIRQN